MKTLPCARLLQQPVTKKNRSPLNGGATGKYSGMTPASMKPFLHAWTRVHGHKENGPHTGQLYTKCVLEEGLLLLFFLCAVSSFRVDLASVHSGDKMPNASAKHAGMHL